MFEDRANIEERLLRGGIPRVDRERILGDMTPDLAERITAAESIDAVKSAIKEHYAERKAEVTEDE